MDIYLSIDGVYGGVDSAGHEGTISIESFDFDIEGAPMMGEEESRSSLSVLSFITLTKMADKASAALFNLSCNGRPLPEATISFMQLGNGENPLHGDEFMSYVLEKARVKSYAISQQPESDSLPIETIKLAFDKIHFKYTVYDKTGRKVELMRGGYDIGKGRELRE